MKKKYQAAQEALWQKYQHQGQKKFILCEGWKLGLSTALAITAVNSIDWHWPPTLDTQVSSSISVLLSCLIFTVVLILATILEGWYQWSKLVKEHAKKSPKIVAITVCLCAALHQTAEANADTSFADRAFACAVQNALQQDTVGLQDLHRVSQIALTPDVSLDSILLLHDFARVTIGDKGSSRYFEGIVVDHMLFPGTVDETASNGPVFHPGVHTRAGFLPGGFMDYATLFGTQQLGWGFVPGQVYNHTFVPGIVKEQFIPGIFISDMRAFFPGRFSNKKLQYGFYALDGSAGIPILSQAQMVSSGACTFGKAFVSIMTDVAGMGGIGGTTNFLKKMLENTVRHAPITSGGAASVAIGVLVGMVAKELTIAKEAIENPNKFADKYCPDEKPTTKEVNLDPINLSTDSEDIAQQEQNKDKDEKGNKSTPSPDDIDTSVPDPVTDPVGYWVVTRLEKSVEKISVKKISQQEMLTGPQEKEDPFAQRIYLVVRDSLQTHTDHICSGGNCPDYLDPVLVIEDATATRLQLQMICASMTPDPDTVELCAQIGAEIESVIERPAVPRRAIH